VVIVAAGLSPAWQQILLFDAFTPDAVNRARQAQWCGSGKVLNVGIGLAHLAVPNLTISPLGGPARAAIEAEFRALSAPLHTIGCQEPTRICTTILDRAAGTTTELVENARPLATEELAAFIEAFAAEAARARVAVLTGSLPSGTPSSLYRDLLRQTSAMAVIDARGPELLAALEVRPLLVKPNREELAQTVGHALKDDAALLAAMRRLNASGAQWVVVTSGKEAVWVSSSDKVYRLLPPAVDIVTNPIGCGDALTAGLAAALARGESVIDAARYGMAAAADRLRSLLPGRLDLVRIATIAKQIRAQEV
jgi:tagatose 6-phosphate kinase